MLLAYRAVEARGLNVSPLHSRIMRMLLILLTLSVGCGEACELGLVLLGEAVELGSAAAAAATLRRWHRQRA